MNLNYNSVKIAREMLREAEELRISSANVGGATRIDFGVHAEGSVDAGEFFIRACMGDLAEVKFSQGENGLQLVEVATEHPALACFGSQKAGWRVAEGDYYAIASGPARILARKPRETPSYPRRLSSPVAPATCPHSHWAPLSLPLQVCYWHFWL